MTSVKRGTTVCKHGTPTDRDCLLCEDDVEYFEDEEIQELLSFIDSCTLAEIKLAKGYIETLRGNSAQ